MKSSLKYYCVLMALAASTSSIAQGLYNKGATISVAPNTILVVPDSLVNKGTIINNGDLRISGAWINDGTYDAEAGQINFNSNIPQTINHNDQSVGKLTISGGGEKKFLANITVESELRLESGVLTSSNDAAIIINKAATITGGSNSAHIKGPVQHSGAGTWVFPIGNGTTYLPVTISGVTSATAQATVSLHELTTGETLTVDRHLAAVSSKRTWHIVSNAGALNNATLTLPIADEGNLTSNSSLGVVAGSTTALGPFMNLGASALTGNMTQGTVSSKEALTYSYYAVGAVSGDRSLMVYNAISPNGDGKNDFMEIFNIELYPDNRVLIINRWGDRVFEANGYDNNAVIFKGEAKNGTKLPAGTYYYTIDPGDGSSVLHGYVVVK